MPSHASRSRAVDDDADDRHRGIDWRRGIVGQFAARVLRVALRVVLHNPRDLIGGAVALAAVGTILVNALYLQPGPHPAPIFSVRSRPVSGDQTGSVVTVLPRPRPADLFSAKPDAAVAARPRADLISDIQRELSRRGFYDGPVDGVPGPRTDTAIQDFAEAAGLKPAPEPSEELLRMLSRSTAKAPASRTAAAGQWAVPPSRRVTAVQRALSEFGYGPAKIDGVIGLDTKTAIEQFERERKLPITGQITDRLIRELSAATGRSLE